MEERPTLTVVGGTEGDAGAIAAVPAEAQPEVSQVDQAGQFGVVPNDTPSDVAQQAPTGAETATPAVAAPRRSR